MNQLLSYAAIVSFKGLRSSALVEQRRVLVLVLVLVYLFSLFLSFFLKKGLYKKEFPFSVLQGY